MEGKVERGDKGFRKLIVWQKAHQLALLVYKLTDKFPKSEIYGLTSQLRRAVVSVPANIAEDTDMAKEGRQPDILILHRALYLKLNIFLFFHST